jgi:hypothetical protein
MILRLEIEKLIKNGKLARFLADQRQQGCEQEIPQKIEKAEGMGEKGVETMKVIEFRGIKRA